MQDNFFSIFIPTYNMGHLIQECIESALSQTYWNYEVIISDNASTDNTETVVKLFDNPKLKYFRNERNIGMYPNLNNILHLCSGKYIKILCADDTISSVCLEVINTFIATSNQIIDIISIKMVHQEQDLAKKLPQSISSIVYDNCLNYCNPNNLVIGCGLPNICYSMNVLKQNQGFFSEGIEKDYSKDIITAYGLLQTHKIYAIDVPLMFERPHSTQNRHSMNFLNSLREHHEFFNNTYPNSQINKQEKKQKYEILNTITVRLFLTCLKRSFISKKNYFKYYFSILNQSEGYRLPLNLLFKEFVKRIVGSILPT